MASVEKLSVEGDENVTVFYQAEKRMVSLKWRWQGRGKNRTVNFYESFKATERSHLPRQGYRREKVRQMQTQQELD